MAAPKAAGTEPSPAVADIDARIAIVRANLRELTEQAAALAGGSIEDALQDRIDEQETRLQLLRKQREELVQRESKGR